MNNQFNMNVIPITNVIPGIVRVAPLYCDPNREYWVSETGIIYGKTGIPLATSVTNSGYERVNLLINGRHFGIYVHKAVLMSFCPIENVNQMQVNHIDGNKFNNHLSNLEWVTPSENIRHSLYVLGNIKNLNGGFKPGNQYAVGNQSSIKAILGIDKDTNEIKYRFKSTVEAGKYFANGDPVAEQVITRRIYKAKESHRNGYNAFYANCYWVNEE